MISINHLTVEFNARPLFDDISFVINRRDRIALAGKNGAGKSTLLKILAGEQRPSSGAVALPSGLTIGYLPQQMTPADDTTVMEEARKAFAHVERRQQRLDAMNSELAGRTDYESEEYAELIERVADLTDRIALDATENHEAAIERTLTGLGFTRRDFDRPTKEFSGGWRMRIELAKILLQRPDVLLLDEPTNHLDIESIQWLEQFMGQYPGAVVLVSHDRAFLDNVTKRTIEITLGRIYDYAVSYTKYTVLRRERLEQQQRALANQQKQIADTEAFIERFRYKATKSNQVQSRIKQLEKIERIELDDIDTSAINLRFPPAPRSGDYPVIADNVGKAFGDHQVFDGATFTLKRGDKVAFVGKNGEGKSTMVKCIMGELQHTGTLRLGHNVKIGYFAQNQASLLDPELTVFDTIDRVAVGDIRTKIRDILGAFMFGGEASDKKVKVLSGGERTRLAMIRLLLEPVNLLILDEPTNHLDIPSKEVLKQAISDFDGTVILVSHDRAFLDGLVETVYEFGGGRVVPHLGGISDFLHKKRLDSLQQLEAAKISPQATPSKEQPRDTPSQGKEDYAERRRRERELKKAERAVEQAMQAVEAAEAKVKELEAKIAAGGDLPQNIYWEHGAATEAVEAATKRWEAALETLEELQEKK